MKKIPKIILTITVMSLGLIIITGLVGYLFLKKDNIGIENNKTKQPKAYVDIPKNEKDCIAQDGQWGKIGLYPEEVCNIPASDAGKICNDSGECQGSCIAALSEKEYNALRSERGKSIRTNGACSSWLIIVGCLPVVENGRVNGILCVD